ncbi:23S rRNA (uridine(2552)-2'-O)-methyltransferase RlmE [Leucothrix pacifica]|uniref:Ribosomal RNA large subunit methyltransferase E n=1 Tax=Leucothrix pacifica TaxID=1247513 RepID=A0A317CPU9_9GAMM|nr:23S rRNA (uridine(2552)-2'-O)-methyltransferase RlmE [Leucothrix pacifica]PWR00475.1 23S rRNA (uridine(2552)-2'-O)-methyltransferase RlmE [Leucothrix pacifica]
MARSKSSTRWLKEHFDDEYVKLSQKEGYRSRAIYKLKEIQEKDRLITQGMTVVDLGAAPGGWSQYATELVGTKGRVIASDILPIDPLPFVEFIQGDFTEDSILNELLELIGNDKANVVISDMAPNLSGNDAIDQPGSVYLCELALDMSQRILAPGGAMVVKLFQGVGSDQYIEEVKRSFRQVKIRKPKASRARSREVYVVATQYFSTN